MLSAAHYYAGTERAYLALCPQRSGHMNMGYWPASSLQEAQERLITDALAHCRQRTPGLRSVIDAGSGWGGTARLLRSQLPDVRYTGVNVSAAQVQAATARHAASAQVAYVCSDIRAHVAQMAPADALLSVEAAFHFEDKAAWIHALRGKVRSVTLLEICIEQPRLIERAPLLRSSLGAGWSLQRYLETFRDAGFRAPEVEDVSAKTFGGFAEYLRGWDCAGYDASRAVLRQFRRAFQQVAELARGGALRYMRLSWCAS